MGKIYKKDGLHEGTAGYLHALLHIRKLLLKSKLQNEKMTEILTNLETRITFIVLALAHKYNPNQ
jgi:hypothetical protein